LGSFRSSIPILRGDWVMEGSNGNGLGGFPMLAGEQNGLVIADEATQEL
jgi:hypothetical protein